MELLKIVAILAAIGTNLFLGFITISKNSKSVVNQTLAAFAGVFALWSLSLFFYDYPVFLSSLAWIKITYLFVIFGIVGFLYYLGYIFPDGKSRPPFWGQILYLLGASILSYFLLFTDLFIKEVTGFPPHRQTILGSMYIPFIIFDTIFGFWGLGLLVKKYHQAKGRIKLQLKYLFAGLALFVTTVLILDSVIPLLTGDSQFFSISSVGSLFFVIFTVYSIIKFRFLDIRIAFQEVLAFTLTTAILSVICFTGAVIFWVSNGMAIKYEVILVVSIVSIILALLFKRIVSLSRFIVGKLTGQPFYDFEKTVLKMSSNLTTTLEIDTLISNLCGLFTEFLGVKDIAFVTRNASEKKHPSPKDNYSLIKKIGFENELSFMDDGILITYVERNPQLLVLEEIGALIERSDHEVEKYYLRELYTHMEYSKIALILPLVAQNQVLGLVVLGSKKLQDPFTVQDINLLTTTMSQFANALENAISYTKIKHFNEILTDEISRATVNLQDANERLKDLDKLKDDFVSVASHELRTPMTAIRSYAWMALHKADIPLSEKVEKYLIRVLISTERLINLVNDMLNVSRIESGKIEIVPESVDLRSLVKDIVDEVYYSKAREKTLEFIILDKPIPKAFADPEKLRQVLLNLVGNSLKFTPDGGNITFDFFSDGKTVEVSVKDSGVGISKEDLGRLFQKFGRLDNSYVASASSGGTGLGLFISKNLLELMHGKIKASSEGLGKGSTFSIAVPVANATTLKHAHEFTIKVSGEAKGLEPVAI